MFSYALVVLLLAAFGSSGSLDFSAPLYTIRYRGYHVNVFQSPNVTSGEFYHYTPSCLLVPSVTKALSQEATGPHFIILKLTLWNDDYLQHIRTFITQRIGHETPLLRPVPFNWIRIDSINNIPSSNKWKSIANHPATVTFRIRCATIQECEQFDELIKSDSEHFASSMELAFSYRAPQKARQAITIELEHLQASPTFSAIKEQFPETNYVFVQRSDFNNIVQETVTKSVESSLGTAEFIDDDQLDGLFKQASRILKLRHNVTSTAKFTEEMWESTYWHEEDQRPDRRAKHLESLFSNGMNLLERVLNIGDNVTVVGFAGSSRAVTDALAELRRSDGPVQWDGKRILVAHVKLYCINLIQLKEQSFGNLSVQATRRAGDYYSSVHSLTHTNAVDLSKERRGAAVDQQHKFNETVKALLEEHLQSLKLVSEEKFFQSMNRTMQSINTLENHLTDVGNGAMESVVNFENHLTDVKNRTTESVVSLENQLTDVNNRTKRLETNLTQLNEMVSNLTEQLQTQSNSGSHESDPQKNTYQLMEMRLHVLERNKEGLEANVSELTESHATVMRALIKLESFMESSLVNNSVMENTLETHIRAMDSLVMHNITVLKESLEELKKRAESATNSANLVMNNVSLLGNRINVLEQTCDLNNQKVTTLVSKTTEMSSQLQTVAQQSLSTVLSASDCTSNISKLELAALPIGSIVAFPIYGTFRYCWLECNGQSFSSAKYPKLHTVLGKTSVPNLSSRFLLGRSSDYALGSTGGEESHTLTISEMPSHAHAARHDGAFMDMNGQFSLRRYAKDPVSANVDSDRVDYNSLTASSGNGGSHNNMPPYQAVAFIIRAC